MKIISITRFCSTCPSKHLLLEIVTNLIKRCECINFQRRQNLNRVYNIISYQNMSPNKIRMLDSNMSKTESQLTVDWVGWLL